MWLRDVTQVQHPLTRWRPRFATVNVMFASALRDEQTWAVPKQCVVRVGHIRDAVEFFVRWNKHHRTCQAAVDELQQGMQQLQQPQHDGTEGVMVATVLDALLSTAPDGDCWARQTCEHLQDSAAVDGVAVPGTIDVATRVPPPADQVANVSAVVSPADGRRTPIARPRQT